MAPLWISYERGLFQKYGLDAQIVFIESGSTAVKSLISKDAAFAQMAGAGVLQSNLRGADVVLIAGFLNTMDYQLMVDKSITRPDQLKGKTMAVSRFGSSSDFATRYALDKYGLVPERDVTILEIGSQPARFAALESGKIQAAMIAVPLTLRAKALGFHALADLQMLGLEYQHTGLATSRELVKSRPDLIRNVMKAYIEGIHYYKTHRNESLAILMKYLKTTDTRALTEVYESIGLALLPERPYPTLKGIEIMLRELAGTDPKAKSARPEDFVNMTFIKELDSSGFIDALYKAGPRLARSKEILPGSTSVTDQIGPVVASPVRQPRADRADRKETVSRTSTESKVVLPSPNTSGVPREYTVVSGDSLSRIAFSYYGDGSEVKWMKIYQANRDTIKNPNYIFIGQKIVIPPNEREVL
jgi:NitT/TauT family transport system substrate-binding protein